MCTLIKSKNVRIGWLKFMYIWNIVIAGAGGLGIVFLPELTRWLFNIPIPKIIYGIIGSLFIAFAVLSIFGLKDPIKFAPVLLFQLLYKAIWITVVVFPMLISGEFSIDYIPAVAIYLTFIVGDFIAVPFSNILENI